MPTADSGQISKGTTGGDAAGTLNLDAPQQKKTPSVQGGAKTPGGNGA
jgi:hypothetical protein